MTPPSGHGGPGRPERWPATSSNEAALAIPEGVRTFLCARIESYEQLEALLLLYARGEQRWSVGMAAAELHIDERLTASALEELRRHELIEVFDGPHHRLYGARPDDELRQLVDLVARAYAENRIEIVRLMSTNAIERMRAAAARAFADAFLIRRKRDG